MTERDEMKGRLAELSRMRRGTEASLNSSMDQSRISLDTSARALNESAGNISVCRLSRADAQLVFRLLFPASPRLVSP